MSQQDLNKSLMVAAGEGHLDKVQSLLAFGALVNYQKEDGTSAALRALKNGHESIVKYMVKKGYNIKLQDGQGRTVLHEAILNGSGACIDLVLSQENVDINLVDNQGWTPLFWAVNRGQFEVVKDLIEKNCDTQIRDFSGKSVLHEAAECGKATICQLLIDAGCSLDAQNSSGETPLLLAAIEGHDKVVELLIKAGANVNIKTDTEATALLYAAICGNENTARILLEANADVNTKDSEGNTPLVLSAKYGHQGIVDLLIKFNCDVYIRNSSNRTALHAASENDQGLIVEKLLSCDVDPAIKDMMGKTALSVAAQLGQLKALKPLAATKCCINTADVFNMTPLLWTVVGKYVECAKCLIEEGADPNVPNASNGNTPLIAAMMISCNEIARLLIQANCNVNAINNQEHAALHTAADKGNTGIIESLLPAGAYVDMQTSKGDTAIMIATRRGHSKVVQILLEVHAHVHIKNRKHISAIHEAALWGRVEIAKQLVKAGANVNSLEAEGDSALMLAAMKGHAGVVALFLQQGCDVNHSNDMGRSALMEAAEHGNLEILKLLLKYKAKVDLQDAEGDTALMLASTKGHQHIVQGLISAHCDFTQTNRWGRNALHEACSMWNGMGMTVELLLMAGICPDTLDGMENTPLILATLSGNGSIVWHLLKANCDVNRPGKSVGKSIKPIQIATTKEIYYIAQMLYLAGCDMNAVNVWMTTSKGPMYLVPVKNAEMKIWLQYVTSVPRTLKLSCRHFIRNRLGYHASIKISVLPLPSQLKQFLNLHDIEGLVDKSHDHRCKLLDLESESDSHSDSGTVSPVIAQSPSF